MQAVILAAGRGTRMGSKTDALPKPMLMVGGRTLLEYKLAALPPSVEEVVLVVGYQKEKISDYFGNFFCGKKIRYVVQEELKGTGDALLRAKPCISGKFIVMMGDDIYSAHDVDSLLSHEWGILVHKVKEPRVGGQVTFDSQNHVLDIVEGAMIREGGYLNTGLYVMNTDLFNHELVKLPGREEWGLPQPLLKVAGKKLQPVISTMWIQITSPEDLLQAELLLLSTPDTFRMKEYEGV